MLTSYLKEYIGVDNNMTHGGLNWEHLIKCIFDNIGPSNIWIQRSEIDIPFNFIQQIIVGMYKQTWYSSIHNFKPT